MRDLVIVGGGPAGMTAAVYAARKKLDVLLLSKDLGGQALWSRRVENYMGYQYIEGSELMAKFESQVSQFPLDQKLGYEAKGIYRLDGGFQVDTQQGEAYQAKAVIVATGKRPRKLEVPGEDRLRGRGVAYCAVCDGPLFAGEKVAVVGGGNSAIEATIDMTKIADHVYLISRSDLKGDSVMLDKLQGAANLTLLGKHIVLEVLGDAMVNGVRIRDADAGTEELLKVTAVFVEIGLIPNSDLAKGITRLNNAGEIEVTCSCETDVPGLFAAGDVTNIPDKQIVVAAGEGAKAALQAHRYLRTIL
jgi:alkyl hydroperoxide reductase subunit F